MQSGSSDVGRRRFLKRAAVVGIAGSALAGCSGDGNDGGGGGGDGSGDDDSGDGGGSGGGSGSGENDDGSGSGGGGAEVAAGPGGNFTFEPEEVTISTGETVTWTFESGSHNVECKPSEEEQASLPDGAEPFDSYDGENRFAPNGQGTTYEHTFDVAGTYTYVCVPHVGAGMIGTVVVE